MPVPDAVKPVEAVDRIEPVKPHAVAHDLADLLSKGRFRLYVAHEIPV